MHHHQINNIYICFFHYFCCLAFKDSFFLSKISKWSGVKNWGWDLRFYLDDDYYYYYDRNGGSLCAGQRWCYMAVISPVMVLVTLVAEQKWTTDPKT